MEKDPKFNKGRPFNKDVAPGKTTTVVCLFWTLG